MRHGTGGINDLLATYGSFSPYQPPQTVTDDALRDAIALRPDDVRGLSQSQRDRLFANALALPNYRARPDLDLSADGRC